MIKSSSYHGYRSAHHVRQNAMVWNDLEQITKRIEATPKQATQYSAQSRSKLSVPKLKSRMSTITSESDIDTRIEVSSQLPNSGIPSEIICMPTSRSKFIAHEKTQHLDLATATYFGFDDTKLGQAELERLTLVSYSRPCHNIQLFYHE